MSRELMLKMIFSATEKVSGPMKLVKQASSAMGRELLESTEKLETLNKAQKNLTGFRGMRLALRDNEKAYAASQDKVAALAREIAQADKPTRQMTTAFNKAKRESIDLKNRVDDQRVGLGKLRDALGDSGINTKNFSNEQKKLQDAIAKTTTEVGQQKTALKQLDDRKQAIETGRTQLGNTQARAGSLAIGGAGAVAGGVAIGAPLVAAAGSAITFESKMIDVKKVLNDVSSKQLDAIGDGLLKMSTQLPITAEGLGQIAAEGARAGIAANDLLPFTKNAAIMATAFEMTAEESGAMMAKWRTGLGLTIPQTVELGDKVNRLTNEFGGSAPKVTDMITRVGPLGKIAGIASGEMAALSQVMNSAGVESEIGATGLKRLMLTLNVGTAATNNQADAFSRLGLDAETMAKTMQTDAKKGILSVLDAVNQLPKEQQAGVLTQLFGSESVASIAPLLSRLDLVKRNFTEVGDKANYAGSMGKEFGVAMSKTENEIIVTQNSLDFMGISLGDQLIPAIKIGLGWVKNIAIGMGEWARENPTLTKYIGMTVGVIAGLLVVVGGLAIGIAAIMGPFALLRFSFLLAGPQIAMVVKAFRFLRTTFMLVGRAFLLNPIGLAITAIAIGAYLIYKNWDKIVPWFNQLWGKAKAIFFGAWEGMKNLFLNYTPHGLIIKHWDVIVPWFTQLWGRVKNAFANGWTNIKTFASTWPSHMLQFGKDMIGSLVAGIKSAPGAIWDALKNIVGGALSKGAALLGFSTPAKTNKGPKIAGARAKGGPVIGGRNYLIGEEGPEILTAPFSGHILPNQTLQKISGSPTSANDNAPRSLLTSLAASASLANAALGSAALASAPAAASDHYQIIINGVDTQSAANIAKAVKRELKIIEDNKRARQRSAYYDA